MSILVLGHKNPDTDSVVSALAACELLRQRGDDVTCAAQGRPAPETEFVLSRFSLQAPEIVESVSGRELFCVDYSDLAQAPADFASATLKGIIDHHKLGDMTSDAPIEAWIKPVGCTCSILKNLFDYYNAVIPKDLAGAMLCAILSDTVLFKSPTCTPYDRKAATALASIAGIDEPLKLGMEMFKAKSNLDAPARDLVLRDFKDFDMGGRKIGIGQLELVSLDLIGPELKDSLKSELGNLKSDGRYATLLVLTDILKEGSELLVCADNPGEFFAALSASEAEPWLPGVLSRKKQIVPPLMQAFK